MGLRYETVDVFTDTAFGGNPLAVVFGAEGQPTERLQQVAREFNYSETAFVLPPQEDGSTAQVRIFTPYTELPFAGHPNVGTATVVARGGELFGRPIGDKVVFDEAVGPVHLTILRDAGRPVGAVLAAPSAPVVEGTLAPDRVARAAGLELGAVLTERHAPSLVSVGPHFLIAELSDLGTLGSARSDAALIREHLGADAPKELYLYACLDRSDATMAIRSRMFAPAIGIPEDPATGAAAVVFAGLIAALEPGDMTVTIDQGVEMGRPSRIDARINRSGDGPFITIAGRCVAIRQGTIEL